MTLWNCMYNLYVQALRMRVWSAGEDWCCMCSVWVRETSTRNR